MMTKYEYRTIDTDALSIHDIEHTLNEYGKFGWKVISHGTTKAKVAIEDKFENDNTNYILLERIV